ncbi:MAG TPA: hypothetical protein VFF06_25935 [Polyangia bacterium]|nr:hypothetical protein [Polyangia bacterium]
MATLLCGLALGDESVPGGAPPTVIEYAQRQGTVRAGRYPAGTRLLVTRTVSLSASPDEKSEPASILRRGVPWAVPSYPTFVRVIGSTDALVRVGGRVDRWYHVEQPISSEELADHVDGWVFGGDVTPLGYQAPYPNSNGEQSWTYALRINDDFQLSVETVEVPAWVWPTPPRVFPLAACDGGRGGTVRAWRVPGHLRVELRGSGCATASTLDL